MPDIYLLKLQYEILNTPLEVLADVAGISVDSIAYEAKRSKWTQRWPEAPPISASQTSLSSIETVRTDSDPNSLTNDDIIDVETSSGQFDLLDADEFIEGEMDAFIASTQRRLKVFILAKDAYLITKYAELESSLITRIQDIVDDTKDPAMLHKLASAFTRMLEFTSGTAKDVKRDQETGLPLVVMRDLSGSGLGQEAT